MNVNKHQNLIFIHFDFNFTLHTVTVHAQTCRVAEGAYKFHVFRKRNHSVAKW